MFRITSRHTTYLFISGYSKRILVAWGLQLEWSFHIWVLLTLMFSGTGPRLVCYNLYKADSNREVAGGTLLENVYFLFCSL